MKISTSTIIGQTKAVSFFEKLLAYEQAETNRLGGTYIISGPPGSGKSTLLDHFLKKLAEISETIIGEYEIISVSVLSDKKEIGVEQARDFNRRLGLSSFGAGYRIGVIQAAERLSLEAANALLKTLEEARAGIMIFLLTSDAERLPTTIRSRGQIINLSAVSSSVIYDWLVDTHHVSRGRAKDSSRLAGGQPGKALTLAQQTDYMTKVLRPAKVLLESFSVSLAERWQAVEKLLKNDKNSAPTTEADNILLAWSLVVRDLLLVQLQQPALVMHSPLLSDLELIAKQYSLNELCALDNIITQARRYLHAHVNPKTVLEQVLMNLP